MLLVSSCRSGYAQGFVSVKLNSFEYTVNLLVCKENQVAKIPEKGKMANKTEVRSYEDALAALRKGAEYIQVTTK